MTGGRPRRWTRRARTSTCLVAAVAVVIGLGVTGFGSSGAASLQVDLDSGTAWFASPASGSVSMIHGPTVQRVQALRGVVPDGDLIEAVQAGDDGFLVDRTDGTLRHLDSAKLAVGPPIAVDAQNPGSLKVNGNDQAVWVVKEGGSVQQMEPSSGSFVGGTLPFPGTVGSIAVTSDGTLWVLDPSSGLVR